MERALRAEDRSAIQPGVPMESTGPETVIGLARLANVVDRRVRPVQLSLVGQGRVRLEAALAREGSRLQPNALPRPVVVTASGIVGGPARPSGRLAEAAAAHREQGRRAPAPESAASSRAVVVRPGLDRGLLVPRGTDRMAAVDRMPAAVQDLVPVVALARVTAIGSMSERTLARVVGMEAVTVVSVMVAAAAGDQGVVTVAGLQVRTDVVTD